MDRLRTLKDEASRAMSRGRWHEAARFYEELMDLEPKEGTWPLRAGDAARKLGDAAAAIRWYQRAASTYACRGLMVRAIAVGKMIESIEPGNDQVLRALDAGQEKQPKNPPPADVKVASVPRAATQPIKGPPLGELSGPPLRQSLANTELSLRSVEVVFDDADDGLPIPSFDVTITDDIIEDSAEPTEDMLIGHLPAFPLFQALPRGAFLAVASRMEHLILEPEEIVIRQGERGTALYAIIEGKALVYAEGPPMQPLATLGQGEVFGEIALVFDQPRAATVKATTRLELFRMDRELFRSVFEEYPQLGNLLSRMIKRRLVENAMGTAPLFQQLDHHLRGELMGKFEIREAPLDTKIVEQGTVTDGLYVVLNGEVRALVDGRQVATLSRGQIFGVNSLIDATHKSLASFNASKPSLVLRLPRSAFHEVISCYPPVLAHLTEVAASQQEWSEGDSLHVV